MKYIVNSKPSDKEDMLTGRCGLLPREEREKVEFKILIVGVSALARSIRAKALGLAGKR